MIYRYKDTRPTLGERVYIAPNAAVIGDVTLGDDASVWFSVTVRADLEPIRIGARTNLQDGSVVHVTGGKSGVSIGDDCTVGHLALVHGCTIGHRVLVGMGSTVLDGAEVGDDVIIAAGSLVTPRMVIPPMSMVMGRPAKVVRSLTENDVAWVRASVLSYVESARAFREDVEPIL
jgi:carbonic anhydrase/acetyltransferase-like protein (isoleucine patch superfamily)